VIAITKPKKKSTKEATPNFVLTLKLNTELYQEDILNKRLDIGRRIYNACLNELGKRYRLMVESKEYQRALKLPKEDGIRNRVLLELNKKYRLTEYSLHNFVKLMQHHFKKDLVPLLLAPEINTLLVRLGSFNEKWIAVVGRVTLTSLRSMELLIREIYANSKEFKVS